jgi:phospholipase D1/2
MLILDSYISFFSLANYDFIFQRPHFSQIYVHSKLLLIDDKVAVIGSANINDRSMIGKHDSEIAVVIEDTNNTSTIMNGKIIKTGKSLKKLRKRLWREHIFGDNSFHQNKSNDFSTHPHTGSKNQETKLAQRLEDLKYEDPISDKTYFSTKKRARENTIIYEQVFPHYPCKRHLTLVEYRKDLENYVQDTLNPSVIVPENTLKLLSNIKGHIVEYPRDWLKNDPLKKDKRLRLLDENLFY